jgi:hypothetical protein
VDITEKNGINVALMVVIDAWVIIRITMAACKSLMEYYKEEESLDSSLKFK